MHRIAVLLAVTAALVAATATPAGAAPRDTFAGACTWDGPGAETFGALRTLAASKTGARAGERDAPGVTQTPEEVPASARRKGGKGFRATIPVYFHVITDGSTGDLSNLAIRKQMDVLNLTFGGFEGGAASGFTFKLAGVQKIDNADWFYNLTPGSKVERDAKSATHIGGADVLNVWTTYGPTYLGFATFPGKYTKYKTHPELDGIVLDYASFPGGAYGDRYSLGKTATHEVGHWLGLYHTFQGGCSANGDYVDDTPFMLVPTGGCPEGKDTCPEPGLDPIHNYMDYSFDSCYSEFTPGQVARAQDQWLYFRAGGGTTVGG